MQGRVEIHYRSCKNNQIKGKNNTKQLQGGPSGRGTQFADIKIKYELLIVKLNSYLNVNTSLTPTRWTTMCRSPEEIQKCTVGSKGFGGEARGGGSVNNAVRSRKITNGSTNFRFTGSLIRSATKLVNSGWE